MTEQNLIPSEAKLITVKETVQPLYSPKQQQDILDKARLYLRPFNKDMDRKTLGQAIGVINDAIFRALQEKGRTIFEPKESLKPLANKGLEIRENLRNRAETFLKLAQSNQTAYAEIIGPLAIPKSLLYAAQVESGNFALNPDIKATQNIVELGDKRLPLLDSLAQIGLDALPEFFSKRTLADFPKISDRAKIIRNMIASFALRGHFSPFISNLDLKAFKQSSLNNTAGFDNETKQLIIELLNLSSDSEKEFISDLFAQTAFAFQNSPRIPNENDPKSTDDFYRRFSFTLLLNHPAWEEAQITIRPDKVTSDQPSLWDEGQKIGNVIIPKVEALVQAARQANAKGDLFSEQRLRTGMRTFIWYEEATGQHKAKIEQEKARLSEREQLLLQLNNPHYPLPQEAYFIQYKRQKEAQVEARYKYKEAERLNHLVKDMFAKQAETLEYEKQLSSQYGDNWPDFVPMPKSAYLEKLLETKKGLLSKHKGLIKTLTAAEDLLSLDILWGQENENTAGFLRRDGAKNRIVKKLESTRLEIAQLETNPDTFFLKGNTINHMNYMFDKLRAYFHVKRSPALPASLKQYKEFWVYIYAQLSKGMSPRNYKFAWERWIPRMLSQRVEFLQLALQTLAEKEQTVSERRNTMIQLTQLASNPDDPLPEKAIWPKAEAASFIRETKATILPNFSGMTIDEVAETANKMRFDLYKPDLTTLPNTISSREQLENWLRSKAQQTDTQLKQKEQEVVPSSGQRTHLSLTHKLSRHLGFYNRLLKYLDTPLMPIDQEVELTKKEFMGAWKKRADLAYAFCYQSRIRRQSIEAQETYERIMRETFTEKLQREIEARRKQLEQLTNRNLQQELVEKFRSLNLVQEYAKEQTSQI